MNDSTDGALSVPQEAFDEGPAQELARIWFNDASFNVALRVGTADGCDEPWDAECRLWADALCDVMAHVSRALRQHHGTMERTSHAKMREYLLERLDMEQFDVEGGFVED